jgi:hypothetical protein
MGVLFSLYHSTTIFPNLVARPPHYSKKYNIYY